jgi:hypothetical protein
MSCTRLPVIGFRSVLSMERKNWDAFPTLQSKIPHWRGEIAATYRTPAHANFP